MKIKSGIGIKALLAFSGLMAICGLGMCDVVINEFELSPPDNGTVWVEIYNTGDGAVDLTGWKINIVDTPWRGLSPLRAASSPGDFWLLTVRIPGLLPATEPYSSMMPPARR